MELLDLVICSCEFYNNFSFKEFRVCYDTELNSDHFPVSMQFRVNKDEYINNTKSQTEKKIETNYDYARANWNKYKQFLEEILKNKNFDDVTEFIRDAIEKAAKEAIPYKSSIKHKIRLLKYILDLIKLRRMYKKQLIHNYNVSNKDLFYTISRTIKEEIKAINNQKWNNFAESYAKNPLSSKKFCTRIKSIRNNGNQNNDNYPTIVSTSYVIETGVLSPILFSIFINDVIFNDSKFCKTKTYSTLFADDLSTFCSSKN